ncbi:MAG: hypothetical protein BWK79_06125 [Beggiatoa sp. IS2]|nr:MAG: hypothetical protein BWK79_06125 [Beggiatoa sp. IS2]
MYKYLDAQGVLHLTDKPPPSHDATMLYSRSYIVQTYQPKINLDELPLSPLKGFTFTPLPPPEVLPPATAVTSPKNADYHGLITDVATRVGVPSALLHAVIKVESGYNPNATSPKGAVGLMQLMSGTAERYGVTDRKDPASSIEGGAQYLRDLLAMFNQDVSLALAAYNAGENAVKRYGNTIPPYRETQNYVASVMAIYQQNLSSM